MRESHHRPAETGQALARARARRERQQARPELHLFLGEQWSDWRRLDTLNEEAQARIEGKQAGPRR